jgi:hypothetical protein
VIQISIAQKALNTLTHPDLIHHQLKMDSSYETVVYDSIDESVTEYEENGPNSTSTVTVTLGSDSKPAGNGRRIIPADYEALIGDLTLPNYNASSTPYFLRKKIVPDYQTVCSGLSVSCKRTLHQK